MDPLTGLSVISSTLQLTDFMFHLLTGTWKVYRSASGVLDSTADIESMTVELIKLSENVCRTAGVQIPHESTSNDNGMSLKTSVSASLVTTAMECRATAQKLVSVLRKLKREKKSVWSSFRVALKTIITKKEVEELSGRVLCLQGNLIAHLQLELLAGNSSSTVAMDQLARWSKSCESNFHSAIQDARIDIVNHFTSHVEPLGESIREIMEEQTCSEEALLETQELLLEHMRHISQQLADLVPRARTCMADMKFLRTVSFGEIRARREGISAAHAKTFEWVFQNRTPDGLHPIHFLHWLRHDKGIFWVRGKPGSGKSTLVKFLRQHPQTKDNLLAWAGGEKLVTANHFFWNAGSMIQKSQEGLFRTILFDVLLQRPELIPQVQQQLFDSDDPAPQWSTSTLSSALLSVTTANPGLRFVFFIDGLDEYEGDHFQLIDILKMLAASPNTKICAAGRPWACFLDAFGSDPLTTLKLEDLTAQDIRSFVDDKIGGNTHFQRYQNNEEYTSLIDEIVSRANGVFLWVALVVRSLLEGLAYSDRVRDLRRRLEALPTDLEAFFFHILDSVDPFYQQQSAQLFLLAIHAGRPLPTVVYTTMDEIDGQYSRIADIKNDLTIPDIESAVDGLTRRLDARTKGLLEVTHNYNGSRQAHERYNVDFLHRTVRDFFGTRALDAFLKERAGSDFDQHLALGEAHTILGMLSTWAYPMDTFEKNGLKFLKWLDEVMSNIGRIKDDSKSLALELLSSLGGMITTTTRYSRADVAWPDGPSLLLRLAVDHRISWYVKHRLKPGVKLSLQEQYNLLAGALNISEEFSRHSWSAVSLDIVQLLLSGRQANPNCRNANGSTLWIKFLSSITSGNSNQQPNLGLGRAQLVEVLSMLVAAGANLQDVENRTTKALSKQFSSDEISLILGGRPLPNLAPPPRRRRPETGQQARIPSSRESESASVVMMPSRHHPKSQPRSRDYKAGSRHRSRKL